MTEFHTAVSEVTPGVVNIRGYSQADIMRSLSYSEAAFLTIIGCLPSAAEHRMTEVILNSLLDHGWVASTITAARYVASGNPQLIPAVAGGILAAGANTLSHEHSFRFLEGALTLMAEQGLDVTRTAEKVASDAIVSRRRIPGFGHPVHRDGDFRADIIFDLADQLGLSGSATTMYRAIHAAFVRQSGKTNIPINIDGCLACVGHDLGWSANQVVAFATLAVLPGLMAHVIEEIDQNVPLRYVHDGDYVGHPLAALPGPAAMVGAKRPGAGEGVV